MRGAIGGCYAKRPRTRRGGTLGDATVVPRGRAWYRRGVRPLPLLFLAVVAIGCGPSIPTRFVLERDLDGLRFRRYQHVLDVELVVEANTAEGHIATYVVTGSETPRVVTAFVTVYDHPASLAAEVRARVATLGSYEQSVERREGAYVHVLRSGDEEWLLWVSGRHVVKLGAAAGGVPDLLLEAYLDPYPSDLDDRGRARARADSAGAAASEAETDGEEDEVPASLREGAPR